MTARLSRVQHSGYEGVLGHAIVYFLGNSTIPNVNFIPENGVNPVLLLPNYFVRAVDLCGRVQHQP
jgi:hypothetical protein